jgi:hypothetical protein
VASPLIRTFRFGDAFLVLALALGTLFFARMNRTEGPGSRVRIVLEDREAASCSLARDTIVTVSGPLGKTVVNIRGGTAWISRAPCRQQTCVHQGKIRLSGQILVCVPNRVCVEIEGAGDPVVDSITM